MRKLKNILSLFLSLIMIFNIFASIVSASSKTVNDGIKIPFSYDHDQITLTENYSLSVESYKNWLTAQTKMKDANSSEAQNFLICQFKLFTCVTSYVLSGPPLTQWEETGSGSAFGPPTNMVADIELKDF